MDCTVTRTRFATADPAAANAFLDEVYADQRLWVHGRSEEFHFEQSSAATNRFALGRVRASPLTTEVQPFDDLLVVIAVRRGRLGFDRGGHDDPTAGRGDVLLAPPDEGFRTTVVEDAEIDTVVLAHSDVALYASSVCGVDPDRVRFTGLGPAPERIAVHWRATVAHVRDIALDGPVTSPLIIESAFRLLAAALVCTFPGTAPVALPDPGPTRWMATRRLDAIVEHLRVHAAEPVGPADCARVADAPAREVDRALRRQRSTTAARELWRARLRGARRDLRAAEPGPGAVADVVGRWGFLRAASFRVAYARAHGETPEQTLGR